MSKWYVGHLIAGIEREAFKADKEPTAEDYPQYGFCVGPFRTKRGAAWASQPGTWFYSISEAEHYAKKEEGFQNGPRI